MKRITVCLITLCTCFSLFGQWSQTNGPSGSYCFDMERIDGQIWVGTEAGLFISDNEGESWMIADFLPQESEVREIFIDGDEILLAIAVDTNDYEGMIGYFYRSTDLGLTWTISELPSNFSDYEISIFKIDDVIFYSDPDLYRSEDNGKTWQRIDTGLFYLSIASNGEQIITAGGLSMQISYDKGDTWDLLNMKSGDGLIFFEGSMIMVENWSDSIFVSYDLGQNWHSVLSPGDWDFWIDNSFVRGASGKLYFMSHLVFTSEDNGYTWDSLNTVSPNDARATSLLELADGEILYGTSKGVFRTSDQGVNWHRSSMDLIGSNVSEFEVLPNGYLLTNTNIGFFQSANNGDDWSPINSSIEISDLKSIVVKGDSVLIAHNGHKLLLSTDNLNTADSIAPLPNVSRLIFKYLGNKYYLLGAPSYVSTDLLNWTELILNDPVNPSTAQIGDMISPEEGILLALTIPSKIYRSTDNGVNWSRRFQFNSLSFSDDVFIVVGDQVLCTDSRSWFSSIENGKYWRELPMEGLPKSQPPTIGWSYHVEAVGNILFAATHYNGVYRSLDYGESWHPFNAGLGSLRTFTLMHANNYLFLGTYSSGVWKKSAAYEPVGGIVYHDLNNNGTQEPGELPFSDVLIKATPSDVYTKTNSNGEYSLYAEKLTDTIHCVSPSPYSVVQPAYYSLAQSSIDLDFGIYSTPNIKDLCITLTNTAVIQPGRDNNFIITVKNVGTTPLSPVVKVVLTNGLNFIAATPFPTQQISDTSIWELPELPAFASQDIAIIVYINTNLQSGSFVTAPCYVFPMVDDQNETNNSYTLVSEVFNSYDPNDKQVEPAGIYTPDDLANGDLLTYTIRFQNIGNFPAQHVRIIDTISERLDLSTFEFLSASHPVAWDIRGENIVEFYFEDILLPDAMSDEADSHGFAKFSIRPKSGLALGELLNNLADIYFDFNDPIRTNTVMTLYDIESGVKPIEKIVRPLMITPNPATSQCEVWVDEHFTGNALVRFYDSSGSIVKNQSVSLYNSRATIGLENIIPGLYNVSLLILDKAYRGRIIVQ